MRYIILLCLLLAGCPQDDPSVPSLSPSAGKAHPVPEPASLVLLLTGLGAVAAALRRK